jgi:acetyl-CoA/propionyl-CoA carboxylase biotin carboxyl carrier protein
VIRACKDAGIGSVAVYADPDRDALHVRLADEAYASAARRRRLLPRHRQDHRRSPRRVRRRLGAPRLRLPRRERRVRPGRHRRRADLDRPAPEAIEASATRSKARTSPSAGAPLAPGTKDPVKDADEVVAFAKEHGLPVAIKAAFGGGGRGLKVARTLEEIPELYESAVREAVSAFGRGECFVEKFLDKPRHVETQCLADQHGNVVVVSTRDCSLQRRHQKLVEEAPAPFLTDEQNAASTTRPRRSCARPATSAPAPASSSSPGRHDLLPRGQHPPPGRALRLRGGHRHRPGPRDVPHRRRRGARLRRPGGPRPLDRVPHQRRGRRPQLHARPRHADRVEPAAGPGVRVDGGYEKGETIPGAFDSLLAKLIVTGATAPRRSSARAARWRVRGRRHADRDPVPPRVVDDPAWVGADGEGVRRLHDAGSRPTSTTRSSRTPASGRGRGEAEREKSSSRSAASGSRSSCPPGSAAWPVGRRRGRGKKPKRRGARRPAPPPGRRVTSPMQGTIVKVAVEEGQRSPRATSSSSSRR